MRCFRSRSAFRAGRILSGNFKAAPGLGAAIVAMALAAPASAQQLAASVEQLSQLSIDQLANLQVTSVSRTPEALSQTPAAVFVITADDIRRSGATSLPEVLRLAPNLEVARLNAAQYTVTARGFNSPESANKLLVLVDGRSVYSPLASTVFWESVITDLDDVERIEVVSGPGATSWGANAVNGVINIITKSAADTQGGLVDLQGGNKDRTGTVRYGGKIGSAASFRVYAKAFDRSGMEPVSPVNATQDGYEGLQGGFRIDGAVSDSDNYTVEGDLYRNHILTDTAERVWGGNFQGRWSHGFADGSRLDILSYFDDAEHDITQAHESLKTYDLQAQQSTRFGDSHSVVYGGEVRFWQETLTSTGLFGFAKPKANLFLGNLFAQDEIALSNQWRLTVGLKVEDNSYSGVDYLPNLRLSWQYDTAHLVWAAVSRAVRTPSRIDRELEAPGILVPSPNFDSEKLVAFELGYRTEIGNTASFNLSSYYNIYDDLRTDEFLTDTTLPVMLANGLKARTYGLEAWADYRPLDWWRLSAGAYWLHRDPSLKPEHTDLSQFQSIGEDAAYQVLLRSQMNLGPVEFDISGRGVDQVGRIFGPTTVYVVPGYVEADARVAWHVTDRVELSLEGFNLLHARHVEVNDPSTAAPRYIPRMVYLDLRTSF